MSLACHAVTVTDECDTQSGMCVTHSPMAVLYTLHIECNDVDIQPASVHVDTGAVHTH